ncbi:hypothetical protein MBCUT_08670 [Methanobrevibacter cuticularis]|uniref:Oligosaccharide repeat unit polymerase n=2 Tax=Methanobrevibacter cuticularis TaxID=47311 RepID=A0A166E825_9EURY|nr:hypothetical protein MBCUT_08670 [Methanobrevibacter cuticularis]
MKINVRDFKNIDLFHPYILIMAFVAFIAISLPILYFSNELPRPSFQVYYFIIMGIVFFVFGVLFPKIIGMISKRFKNKMIYISNIKSRRLGHLAIFSRYSLLEILLVSIVLIGIILQIINFIMLGGIPLLSGVLKAHAATKIWLFSFIAFIIGINILLAKYNRKSHYIFLLIGLGLFALTGYRTTPIAILLSVFITLYYTRNIKIKYQLFFIAVIAILLLIIGFIAVQSIEWQQWRLNALELLSYRAGFTLNILDRATYLAGSTNGSLFYYTLTGFFKSVDPRVLVGEVVLNEHHSITSTILGPAILDFGGIGLAVQMFLIGLILKLLYFIQKHVKGIATAFYGIILAQTFIWIETGPTDLVVWLFYFLGIITIVYYFVIIDNNANHSKFKDKIDNSMDGE